MRTKDRYRPSYIHYSKCRECHQAWRRYYLDSANFFNQQALSHYILFRRAVDALAERSGLGWQSVYVLLEISLDNSAKVITDIKTASYGTVRNIFEELSNRGFIARKRTLLNDTGKFGGALHKTGYIITVQGRIILSELEHIILTLYNEQSGAIFPVIDDKPAV